MHQSQIENLRSAIDEAKRRLAAAERVEEMARLAENAAKANVIGERLVERARKIDEAFAVIDEQSNAFMSDITAINQLGISNPRAEQFSALGAIAASTALMFTPAENPAHRAEGSQVLFGASLRLVYLRFALGNADPRQAGGGLMKRIMRRFVLREISGVDRPAQAPAKVAIIKRAEGRQETKMTTVDVGALAMLVLEGKAEQLRKADPSLTREQAFARAYSDPANRVAAKAERAASRAAIAGFGVARADVQLATLEGERVPGYEKKRATPS